MPLEWRPQGIRSGTVTDQSGFSAIQTGHYTPPAASPDDPSRNRFDHDGCTARWTRDGDPQSAFIRVVRFFDDAIDRIKNRKVFALPVRCVKNAD